MKITKKELEAKRIARNEYSRKWKAAHKAQVKKWNHAWLLSQKASSKKKSKAKKTAAKVKVIRKRHTVTDLKQAA